MATDGWNKKIVQGYTDGIIYAQRYDLLPSPNSGTRIDNTHVI